MSKTPTNAVLRQFISQHFNVPELTSFCFSYFPEIGDEFPPEMPKSARIELLIGYCERRSLIPNLLTALTQEREKSYQQTFPTLPTIKSSSPLPAIIHNPRQIFISHAHQDAEIAHHLADDLEANGYQTWIAPDSIRPGEKWVEAINRGLEECGIFVLVLTPEAVDSRWVQMETNAAISFAQENKMKFYPLMHKTCSIPALWRAFQYISISDEYKRGLNQLLDVIKFLDEAHNTDTTNFPLRNYAVEKKVTETSMKRSKPNTFIHKKTGKVFLRIPGGYFLFGKSKKKKYLREYWISKTLVTNAEYSHFIIEQGYSPPSHWKDKIPPDDIVDHPVVNVSFIDAEAYVLWAKVNLPTELQWEKAARGTDGRIYPWGEKFIKNYANVFTFLKWQKGTSIVGQYSPQGDSPYGCSDMSGNVCEWTDSKSLEDSTLRVTRGGSWRGDSSMAQVTIRLSKLGINSRSEDVGFRIVIRSIQSEND